MVMGEDKITKENQRPKNITMTRSLQKITVVLNRKLSLDVLEVALADKNL